MCLLQNSSLTKNKKRNKKLVAPAIELGKHNVPVDSTDEGSYCSTKGSYLSHDYYLSTNSEDVYEQSPKAKSPAADVIITNVNVHA